MNIEKIIFPGYGFGRDRNGRPIFVSKAVPGDEVKVEIIKDKKSYAYGVITKIIKPSAKRISAQCPHFTLCGGCQHQNISYPDQLNIKQEMFNEVLFRAGVNVKSENILPGSKHPFFYRNSIRFFFIKDKNKNIIFARHHHYMNRFVPINRCYLQSETSNKILDKLKDYINNNVFHKSFFWQLEIREGKLTGDVMTEIITTSEDLPKKEGIVEALKSISGIKSIYHTVAPGKSLRNLKRKLIFGSPIIYEKVGGYKFQISPESFFQTNSYGAKVLYDKIKQFAEIKPNESVLDLFCGTGTISIYLSAVAKRIVGVDLVQKAINDARDNAKLNHIYNTTFVCKKSSDFLSSNKLEFDLIVADPPRAGLDKSTIKSLGKMSFKRIVYASCNPATFARDVNLLKKHNIILKKVQPIDNFPQTHHIESVALFTR